MNSLTLDTSSPSKGRNDVRDVRLRGEVRIRQDAAEGRLQGIDLHAASADVLNGGQGRLEFMALGWPAAKGVPARPAVLVTPDMTITGPSLTVKQAEHKAWVLGAGTLVMQTDEAGLGMTSVVAEDRDQTPAKSDEAARKVPLVIRWRDQMTFQGVYPDKSGRPGPARALFVGRVIAQMKNDRIFCGDVVQKDGETIVGTLEAIMDRPVSFDRSMSGSASTESSTESTRPEVEGLIALGDARLASLERDPITDRVVECRQARGRSISFERPTGHYWIDNVGNVLITALEDEQGQNREAAASLAKLIQTRVDFRKGMNGQIGMDRTGRPDGYRDATFTGDVQVLRAGVPDFRVELEQDRPPADCLYQQAGTLVLESIPAAPEVASPSRILMKANGDVLLRTATSAVVGDTTLYDSLTENVFVRGSNAAVTFLSQEAYGQPTSRSDMRAFKHNLRTKLTEAVEPGSIQFFQLKSGYRSAPSGPVKKPSEKPVKRPEPRMTPRGDLERSGFTGR